MKGFKAFNSDLICRDFQYEIGGEYIFDDEPIPCKQGFHFCKTIADCYNYYEMADSTRICEIEAIGDIATDDEIKYCTNKIRIVSEITDESIKKGNSSSNNLGFCNTGNRNTGDWNTGNWNTGDWNTGDWNTGNRNTGNRNTGNWNTGNRNTGNRNTGNRNTGNRNTGDWNTGNWNTGNWNTGDWNTGDWNTGCFNTNTDDNIRLFNKQSGWTFEKWQNSDARYILNQIPKDVVEWINTEDMSDQEKKDNPEYETTGGYLKVLDETDAAQLYWDGLSEDNKREVLALPNFDPDIFKECTGITV